LSSFHPSFLQSCMMNESQIILDSLFLDSFLLEAAVL
jgi:hypothetical protein